MIFGKHINKYYRKYLGWLLGGILALAIVDIVQMEIPAIYRMLINGINDGTVLYNGAIVPFDLDFLLDKICLPLCVVIVAIVLGRFLWRICLFGTAAKVERDIRFAMFNHAKDLSQQFYQVNKVGNLMSLFTNDIETIQDCFGEGILTFFDAVILGSVALYKMFNMNIWLALFSMLPMICLLVMATLVGKKMGDKWEERQQKFSDLSDFSQESFTGIAVIKAFAKEVKELYAFRKLNAENEKVNVEYTRISTIMDVCITLFAELTIAVILGYGGYLVYKGTFNAGELIEFISYFSSLVWPILAISILIDEHARGKASLKRVSEFLDTKIDVQDADSVKELIKRAEAGDKDAQGKINPNIEGAIRFRHLSFTYPNSEREVLHGISFEIKPGESVGIIGRTGSGKTTIVDLLTRTYEVPDGMLFVDGYDVNTIPIKALRDHIAYVPQDNFLFSESIAKNIAFAFDDEKDKNAIAEAAKMSDVDDNIREFPDQYETVLGERGVTVSGGQKQRISIARALMKNAEILILDDSVSAVDTRTERSILTNLQEARKGKTTILIAHRITTIEHTDKIVFLEDGSLVAVGSHKELLDTCPAYAEMVEMQRLEDERKERA